MSGNSHTDKNSDVADVSVLPAREIIAVDETEEANPAATTQQKRVKAGLLAVLAVIVVYVVLDYTVSARVWGVGSGHRIVTKQRRHLEIDALHYRERELQQQQYHELRAVRLS